MEWRSLTLTYPSLPLQWRAGIVCALTVTPRSTTASATSGAGSGSEGATAGVAGGDGGSAAQVAVPSTAPVTLWLRAPTTQAAEAWRHSVRTSKRCRVPLISDVWSDYGAPCHDLLLMPSGGCVSFGVWGVCSWWVVVCVWCSLGRSALFALVWIPIAVVAVVMGRLPGDSCWGRSQGYRASAVQTQQQGR